MPIFTHACGCLCGPEEDNSCYEAGGTVGFRLQAMNPWSSGRPLNLLASELFLQGQSYTIFK